MNLLNIVARSAIRRQISKNTTGTVFKLNESTLIGRDTKRDCHLHPANTKYCVKVSRYPNRQNAQHANFIEWLCAIRLDRRGAPLDHRVACHGWVNTNQGPGLVVERAMDCDGQPSQTVINAVKSDALKLKQVPRLLTALQNWALLHGVTVNSPSKVNIVVRMRHGQPKFVLIDGVGGSQLKLIVVIRIFNRLAARWKTLHKWPIRETQLLDALEAESSVKIPRRLMPTCMKSTKYPAITALGFAWHKCRQGQSVR